MKRLIYTLFISFLVNTSFATTITIGTGGGNFTSRAAFSSSWGYSRAANLYTSSEIGYTGITIATLAFNVQAAGTDNIPIKIYMKTTSSSIVPTSTTWATMISGATLVYNGSVTFNSTGWTTIDITDFNYSSDNLLVMCESNYGGSGGASNPSFYYTTSTNKNSYWRTDTSPPLGTEDGTDYRADIKFNFTLPPTVTTSAVSALSSMGASGGGNVTSQGEAAVTARGVCWKTSAGVNLGNAAGFSSDGSGTGVFSSSLTSLSAQTLYYVNAYATNNGGTAYGSETSFYTFSTEPSGHSAVFTATASVSALSIDLAFSAASSVSADGYIILRKVGSAPDATGVNDGSDPASLSLPVGTTLITTITSNSATSYTSSGLAGTTKYYYAIIPYKWDASHIATYNYRTSSTIPTASATTIEAVVNAGIIMTGNLVNNGTLIQTSDANYLTMNGSSKTITGSGTYTDAKVNIAGTVTFDGTISSGSFTKTYITSTNTFTINNNRTYINGLMTIPGAMVLNANSKIQNSGNFTTTGTITADATSTVEFNGSAAQSVTTNSNSLGNVTINNSVTPSSTDGIVLGDAMTVQSSSALTLNEGILICNGNLITINNTSATAIVAGVSNSSYTNSWVYGSSNTSCLRRAIATNTNTYSFPVGTASRANLAELINHNLPSGALTVDCWFNNAPANSQAGITSLTEGGRIYTGVHTNGVWTLNKNGNISGTYDLKLYFNGAFSGLTDFRFSVVSRPTSGDNWTLIGHLANTTVSSGYAYRTGLNSFSEKGIALADGTLPVELIAFSAKCENDKNIINWTTVSETNNNYFIVEKSANATDFEIITKTLGAGNSISILNYSAEDLKPFATTYYRLKQVDFNGKYTYSELINTQCTDQNNQFSLFVNENNQLTLNYNTSENIIAKIKIFNPLSQLISSNNFSFEKGNGIIQLPTNLEASGIYMAVIEYNEKRICKKISNIQ